MTSYCADCGFDDEGGSLKHDCPGPSANSNLTYEEHMANGSNALLHLKIASSINSFDKALSINPSSYPKQWMRGIALFFSTKYKEGAIQFSTNLEDNPNDVEEVVWACMCDMKRLGPTKGRANILPCPTKDMRVPMREIYNMFSGAGSVADVLNRRDNATAIFYGHLYVGLYLDCLLHLKDNTPSTNCNTTTTTTTTTTTSSDILSTIIGLTTASQRHYMSACETPTDDFMGRLSTALGIFISSSTTSISSESLFSNEALIPKRKLRNEYYSGSMVGCWQLSSGHHQNNPSSLELNQRLKESIRRGFTTLDMGDIYTGVEEYVGKYTINDINGTSLSNLIQIHTKLVPDLNLLNEWNAERTNEIVRRSCNRLGIQKIHLVQFHWWDWTKGNHIEAYRTLCNMTEFDDSTPNMIHNVGVTNYDAEHLSELIDAGLPVSSNQIQYSLLDRRVEKNQVILCCKNEIRLLCYGVLAGGFLSDRWLNIDDPVPSIETSSLTADYLSSYLTNRSLIKYYLIIQEFGGWSLFQELLNVLRLVANRHSTNIATISQAWILSRPSVGGIIIGLSGKEEHMDSARRAHTLAYELTTNDYQEINNVLVQSTGPKGSFYEIERIRDGVHGSIMRYNCGELWTNNHVKEFIRRVDFLVELIKKESSNSFSDVDSSSSTTTTTAVTPKLTNINITSLVENMLVEGSQLIPIDDSINLSLSKLKELQGCSE